jgi:hypothetical protein
MEAIMTKRLGLRDYAAGKTRAGTDDGTDEIATDETILRNPRNDPETDGP